MVNDVPPLYWKSQRDGGPSFLRINFNAHRPLIFFDHLINEPQFKIEMVCLLKRWRA